MKGQITTIALVLASGITCFIALRGTSASLEWSRDAVSRPLLTGSSGALVRTGAWLTGPLPLALRLIPGLRLAAAVSMTTGSLVTRFGWIAAGRRSATMSATREP